MGFSAGILGTGAYLPEKVMTNFDLEKLVDTSNDWIVERTGIRERRIADPETATSDMCLKAAKAALKDAGVKIEYDPRAPKAQFQMISQYPSDSCGSRMLITFAAEEIGETPSSPFLVMATPRALKNSPIMNKR